MNLYRQSHAINQELHRRGYQNIDDAYYVRDHFIPLALQNERWNIVFYETHRVKELFIKGIICLSGYKPSWDHEIRDLITDLCNNLAKQTATTPFLYAVTASRGSAYGIIVDSQQISVLTRIYNAYTCFGSFPNKLSPNEELALQLSIKDSTVKIHAGNRELFSITNSAILEGLRINRGFIIDPNTVRLQRLNEISSKIPYDVHRNAFYSAEKEVTEEEAVESINLMEQFLNDMSIFYVRDN